MMRRALLFVAVVCACAPVVSAQQPLAITMTNGTVTVRAHGVTVAQILREWAQVGGVQIINAEKVTGPAVTLELTDVSERDALAVILRGVSGYVLAARTPGLPGVAVFDRVVILAASNAPSTIPVAAARAATRPTDAPRTLPGPFMAPAVIETDAGNNPDEFDTSQSTGGAVTSFVSPERRPQTAPRFNSPMGIVQPPQVAAPFNLQGGGAANQPASVPSPVAPAPGSRSAPTATPFFNGSVGNGQPGVVAPVPPTTPSGQTQAVTR